MKRLGLLVGLTLFVLGGSGCPSDPTLDSLSVTPATASIDTGATASFTATATWSDGTTTDVSAEATWSSSDTAVATIDTAGVATGVSSGTATVEAALEGETATATLTVRATTIDSIAVTPIGPLSLAMGATVELTATATYDDASTADISGSATWTSGDLAIATVADGIVSPVAEGSTTVMASVGTVYSNSVTINVTSSVTLTSIELTPTSGSVDVGETLQFSALGRYSDTSTSDLTSTATWSSSVPAIAGIDAAGLASGLTVGTTVITASLDGVTSNDATLEVLTSIPAPGPGDLIVNEFLVDGSLNQDANGDGTIDATEDEFLEIVNVSGGEVDLEGVVIKENQFPGLPRHTFGPLRLADGETVVVFGGGDAPASTAGVTYLVANAADPGIAFGLALTDAGDTLTLEDATGALILTLEWGGTTGLDANLDESLTLDPDLTGTGYVPHSAATGSAGAVFSPGTRIDGSAF